MAGTLTIVRATDHEKTFLTTGYQLAATKTRHRCE
jgi:hypothetical protein